MSDKSVEPINPRGEGCLRLKRKSIERMAAEANVAIDGLVHCTLARTFEG
jgi:hypothetical protein